MPTVLPPPIPRPATGPRPVSPCGVAPWVGRCVRARWGDLWGRSHAPLRDWKRLRLGMEVVVGMTPRADSNPRRPGDAAVARPWGSAARCRQEYQAHAVPARDLSPARSVVG